MWIAWNDPRIIERTQALLMDNGGLLTPAEVEALEFFDVMTPEDLDRIPGTGLQIVDDKFIRPWHRSELRPAAEFHHRDCPAPIGRSQKEVERDVDYPLLLARDK